MAEKLTAKDFERPLLLVLAELTGEVAGAEVVIEEVYPLLLTKMGIPSVDAYGMNEATGLPQVTKWAQWAFKSLREQNLGLAFGRGKWGLTPEGVRQARTLKPESTTPATPKVEPMQTVTATPAAPSAPEYHPDPYIRNLAFSRVACGGAWSAKADKCKDCGLVGSCRNLQAGVLSQLAAKLAAEDKAAADPGTPAKAAPVAPAKAAPVVSGLASKYRLSAADPLTVRADTPCTCCGQVIPKNVKAVWVEGIDQNTDSAVFHEECLTRLRAEAAGK